MAVYSDTYKYIFFANPNTASKAIAKTLKEELDGKRMPSGEVVVGDKVVVRAHHSTYSQLVAHKLMTEEHLQRLFKFTAVRNPYDQMVSRYVKYCARYNNDPTKYPWLWPERLAHIARQQAGETKVKGKKKGEGEGDEPMPQPIKPGPGLNELQADYLNWLRLMDPKYAKVSKVDNGPLDFLNHADYVIRFESLQEGFQEVLKRIGVEKPVEIVEFNVTAAREAAPKKKRSYHDFYVEDSKAIVERMFAPMFERFGYKFDK